jgi:hypothetical protein
MGLITGDRRSSFDAAVGALRVTTPAPSLVLLAGRSAHRDRSQHAREPVGTCPLQARGACSPVRPSGPSQHPLTTGRNEPGFALANGETLSSARIGSLCSVTQ